VTRWELNAYVDCRDAYLAPTYGSGRHVSRRWFAFPATIPADLRTRRRDLCRTGRCQSLWKRDGEGPGAPPGLEQLRRGLGAEFLDFLGGRKLRCGRDARSGFAGLLPVRTRSRDRRPEEIALTRGPA